MQEREFHLDLLLPLPHTVADAARKGGGGDGPTNGVYDFYGCKGLNLGNQCGGGVTAEIEDGGHRGGVVLEPGNLWPKPGLSIHAQSQGCARGEG